jgi:hypothetical protein
MGILFSRNSLTVDGHVPTVYMLGDSQSFSFSNDPTPAQPAFAERLSHK